MYVNLNQSSFEAAETPARKAQRRSVNREIPAVPKPSEQAVDEGCEGRTLGCHEDCAQREQEEDDGNEPPFLANLQEIPELFEDGQLVHGNDRCLSVSKRRWAMILLPFALG